MTDRAKTSGYEWRVCWTGEDDLTPDWELADNEADARQALAQADADWIVEKWIERREIRPWERFA